MDSAQGDLRWQGLHKLGAVTAWIIAVLLIGEILAYAVVPPPSTAVEHLQLLHESWLSGLLLLDVLGMVAYLLFIPTMLSLFVALRRSGEARMAVGTALFFVGISDFLATNTAFPALFVANKYARATTPEDKAMFLAAGQTLFALFNENAFLVSYVIVSAAWTMVSCVMLRSELFSRATAYAGISAGSAGIVAVVLEHVSTARAVLALSIAAYFAAIVFLFVWLVLLGRRLYRLGRGASFTPRHDRSPVQLS